MDKEHREIIIERIIPLVNSVHDFQSILSKSLDFDIFTRAMIVDIMDSNNNEIEQKRNFFLNVTKRGPEAFEKLMQVLGQTNHEITVDILKSEHSFPDCASLRHRSSGPFTESYVTKPIGVVKVRKATELNGGELFTKNVYKMTSKIKGLALVIVNKNFDCEFPYKTRIGAEEDYRLISELFTELDYKIFPYWNKTKEEIEEIIPAFIRNFETYQADSCVVAISSHGEEGGFVCSDNNLFSVQRLKRIFNNENCPILRGKPKMFFIQACRGNKPDSGVPLTRDNADAKLVIPARNEDQHVEKEQPHLPTITDIIIVYPTQLGYQAYINEVHGSWFFSTITRVFMEDAWKVEFQHLLLEVSAQLSRLRSWPDSEKQSTHVENLGWRKKFYFNPGLYKTE